MLLLGLAVVPPEAQELVRLSGWVQWIAATKMQVKTVSGASVAVDLTRVDQSSYQALRGGEVVVVDGVVSDDRQRVVAHEIWRDRGQGSGTQSP